MVHFVTESILPNSWGYDATDLTHLLDIHSKFGNVKLKPIQTNLI